MSGRSQGRGDKKKRGAKGKKAEGWMMVGYGQRLEFKHVPNVQRESKCLGHCTAGTSTGTSNQVKYCVSWNRRCSVTAAHASFQLH